jgi:threonyl-tRNA synthetase
MASGAGRRAYAGGGPRIGETGKFEGEFKIQKSAPFVENRLKVWNRLFEKYQADLASKPKKAIKIELPDGAVKEGKAFETRPIDIALGISKGLAESIVAAKVIYKEAVESLQQCVAADIDEDEPEQQEETKGEQSVLWDLTRPLEGSCRLELLKFDHPQGQDVFWHSSAHILGQAMEREFGCHLTIGPALESGFYYDGFFGDRKIKEDDFVTINKHAEKICKETQPFERCVISKEEALELFSENPFKVQLITNKVPDGALTSCYRCGDLVDLCRGPHLPDTGRAKAFMVTKNSSAYWLGKQELDSLQRLYAISFPNDKLLKEYKKFQEEAAKRDHRNIGKQQELFMFHPIMSPGSCFWFPLGARVYNKLIEFARSEYRIRGFTEVITPNMYDSRCFLTSGHYQNYKDDMYSLDVEKQEWMLKPMNCPGHFLMFDARVRSYKELPIRYADFGVLHRNEASGALTGLTRVRRFQQDDAHIFCRPDQIKSEVANALDFLDFVYNVFGFKASYALSTRPKKALGSKEIWDNAETQLKAALNESGREWSLNPGDGAFYGPKIDIRLQDAMKRKHQCGTIQLDFNGPIRFNLQYRKEGVDDEEKEGEDKKEEKEEKEEFQGAVEKNAKGEVIWREGKLKNGFERPVVIHRAILGSVERMSAILMEHYAGKWPFWLSPRQVMVVPISSQFNDYAQWVERQLTLHGYYAEAELSGKTLNKKVREAQLAQWNLIAVVGESEMTSLSVNLRSRDEEKPLGLFSMTDFIAKLDAMSTPTSQPLRQFEPFQGKLPETSRPAAQLPVANGYPTPEQKPKLEKQGSLQERKAASKQFANLAVDDDVEAFLENHPYVKGFTPSQSDAELFEQLSASGIPSTAHLRRWYEHVGSFTNLERSEWLKA